MTAPYRDSTPRPDAAPRVRRRWALRGERRESRTDMHDAAHAALLAWVLGLGWWSAEYITHGLSPQVLRGAEVVAGALVLWCVVFVTREQVR